MKDSWCKPYTAANSAKVAGSAAREARIADQGGMDKITTKCEMRGLRQVIRRVERI